LCDAWTTLDPHHKTVLSGDFGVGFTTWFLNQTLNFVRYSDTLWVVNTLSPGAFRLAGTARVGPEKSPDYIAEDINGNFSVVECKGSQSSASNLLRAIQKGAPQKANVKAIGATQIVHSLVAGLYIPQFDHGGYSSLVIADPEWDELRERLSRYSPREVGRAVSQVAYAKELAILEMPNTANALVRAEGSDEVLSSAFKRDLSSQRAQNRAVTPDGVRVAREYRWSEPAHLSDDLSIAGVRFEAFLPGSEFVNLENVNSPAEYGEETRTQSKGKGWDVKQMATAVSLQSPFGTRFLLELLEA
jgi:hypothetical protein